MEIRRPAMTLSEVEILMHELGRHINDHTQILFGTSVDGRMGNRLSVTLISSLPSEEEVAPPAAPPARASRPEPIPEPRSAARSTRGACAVPYHAVSTSSVE